MGSREAGAHRIPDMHYISDTPGSAAHLRARALIVMPGGQKGTTAKPNTVYKVKYYS